MGKIIIFDDHVNYKYIEEDALPFLNKEISNLNRKINHHQACIKQLFHNGRKKLHQDEINIAQSLLTNKQEERRILLDEYHRLKHKLYPNKP